MHTYNSTGAKLPDDFTIPDGEYVLRIEKAIEGVSKSGGDYQVRVDFKVAEGQHKNFPINWHRVTFVPADRKGAGLAIHFLKCIGEPWEGEFQIDPKRWVSRRVLAYIEAEEYNGYKNMKVRWTKPAPDTSGGSHPGLAHAGGKDPLDKTSGADEEQVPF